MPAPLLFWGLGVLLFGTGVTAGYASRNAEVERYRQKVRELQDEVRRLHATIEKQQEQIATLKKKYQAVHMLNFLQKQRYDQQMKTILMESYLQKELLSLSNKKIRQEAFSDEEAGFITIMESSEKDPASLDQALQYIEKKYGDRIRERQLPGREMKIEMEFTENLSLDGGPHG